MTPKKGKANVMVEVKGAIKSPADQSAEALWAIFAAFIASGGSVERFGTLASEGAREKQQALGKFALDLVNGIDPIMQQALALFQSIGQISEATDITPPKGGKVFRLLIPIDWMMAWRDCLLRCCPQTNTDWAILNVGEQFPSLATGTTLVEVFLVWFGTGSLTKGTAAIEWAKPYHLEPAHGRIPAAIIGGIPGIVEQLKRLDYPYDSVGVVTPSEFKLGEARSFLCAWRRSDGRREADWGAVGGGWSGGYLFAFVRKS